MIDHVVDVTAAEQKLDDAEKQGVRTRLDNFIAECEAQLTSAQVRCATLADTLPAVEACYPPGS